MQAAIIVAIVFSGAVMALAVIGGTILMAIRIVKGGGRTDRRQAADEAKMLQEIYQGLARMEERVEALETILIHTTKRDAS
jgi:phage shock protein B